MLYYIITYYSTLQYITRGDPGVDLALHPAAVTCYISCLNTVLPLFESTKQIDVTWMPPYEHSMALCYIARRCLPVTIPHVGSGQNLSGIPIAIALLFTTMY